jgi:hypothetical protein
MDYRFIYYSFITLTSTGYGDITPLHPYTRSLAIFEAITGQLYLAVLIARLVGLEMEWREAQRDAAGTNVARHRPLTAHAAGTRLAATPSAMASPVLLLLGVPESGTSALADALVRAGAALAGPPAGDPAGVSQNALAACGMRWDSLAPMPAKFGKSPGLDAARAAMDTFLERHPGETPLLIAEPLATRIAGLWRERIEESGARVRRRCCGSRTRAAPPPRWRDGASSRPRSRSRCGSRT